MLDQPNPADPAQTEGYHLFIQVCHILFLDRAAESSILGHEGRLSVFRSDISMLADVKLVISKILGVVMATFGSQFCVKA